MSLKDDELNRFVKAIVAKMKTVPKAGYTEDEWWDCVIGTTIADTMLVLEGSLTIEDYEKEPS